MCGHGAGGKWSVGRTERSGLTHTPPGVKQTAGGELSSVLSEALEGRDGVVQPRELSLVLSEAPRRTGWWARAAGRPNREGVCVHVADSLCCTAGTQHRKATKLQFKERPHCPNPCSFVGQNGYCDFSNFIFLCQICFSYSSAFTFHVTFRIRWLISTGILIETMLNLKVNLGRDDILINIEPSNYEYNSSFHLGLYLIGVLL